jgi:hypothetical protein
VCQEVAWAREKGKKNRQQVFLGRRLPKKLEILKKIN